MNEYQRFRTREEIRDAEMDDNRENTLRELFEKTEAGEWIQDCVGVKLDVEGDLNESGVVIESSLHHERMFDLVSSIGGPMPDEDSDAHYAAATVIDKDTEEKLSAHVYPEKILITPRTENVSFESFRDYIIYLENELFITLKP